MRAADLGEIDEALEQSSPGALPLAKRTSASE